MTSARDRSLARLLGLGVVMCTERETKEDGRYIIFYSFKDQAEEKGED